MRKAFVTALVALFACGALAASASAATPSNRQLSRQVKTLQRQVKLLQRQVKALRKTVNDTQGLAVGAIFFSACSAAATADAFQGTWETIDETRTTAAQPDKYPPPSPVADPLNSCQRLEIQRQPNTVPPNTNVFAALLNIFR